MSTSDFHGGKWALETGVAGTSLIYYLHFQFEVLLQWHKQNQHLCKDNA